MLLQDINILDELFYSVELWGYLGPLALVIIGGLLCKKDKNLGLAMYIIFLFMAGIFYLPLITTYYMQVFILIFLGAVTCLVPQLSR